MKHQSYLTLLVALLAAFALSSCSETDDSVEEYPDWKKKNEAYFASKYATVKQAIARGDDSWKIFKSYARSTSIEGDATDYILVKVLREGTGSGSPLFTDTVRVHYRGQLLASATHVDSSDSELGYVFDTSWSSDTFDESIFVPSKFSVSGLVEGFSTALQHMHIGDRWRVYIPYELGYGSQSSGEVQPYSTLVFDIALAAYYRPGNKVPQWNSNKGLFSEENY